MPFNSIVGPVRVPPAKIAATALRAGSCRPKRAMMDATSHDLLRGAPPHSAAPTLKSHPRMVERIAADEAAHDEVVVWIRERTRQRGDEPPAIS